MPSIKEAPYKVFLGEYAEDMRVVDPHNHVDWYDTSVNWQGGDGSMKVEQLIDHAVEIGLDGVAITEHDRIGPSIEAKDYALKKGYDIEVITGVEVSTTFRRHVIALGIEDNIPSGKSPEWTCREIHRKGGLVVIPHPMSNSVASLGEREILRLAYHPDRDEVSVDGFELFNAGIDRLPGGRALNERVRDFYLAHGPERLGAALGATDGHHLTLAEGLTAHTEDNFLEAVRKRTTAVLFLAKREPIDKGVAAKQFGRSMVAKPIGDAKRYLQSHNGGR